MPPRENLKNWQEAEEDAVAKEARFMSKYNPDPTLVESSFGPKPKLTHTQPPPRTMPGVPKRHERPVLGLKTTKNFASTYYFQTALLCVSECDDVVSRE